MAQSPRLFETRAVTIHVSERVYAGLIDRARRAGYTPTLLAKLLFEAAYAARCGKAADDPILIDCVERSLERRPPLPPTSPRPVSTPQPMMMAVPVLVPVPIAIPIALPAVTVAEQGIATPAALPELPTTCSQRVYTAESPPVVTVPILFPGGIAVLADPPTVAEQAIVSRPPRGRRQTATGFAPQVETIVDLIARDEGASRAEINRALWGRGTAPTKGLDVVLAKARPRLDAHGVELESVKGWGWRMSPASRAAWAALKGAS